MNRNTVLELILIVSVASIWISGGLALPQYLDAYNTTFNTNASCGICHVNPAGGGARNTYGMMFENQTNHADVAGGGTRAALITIGQATATTPGATSGAITTATSTALATSTAISNVTTAATAISTATLISTPPPFNATPAPTETAIPLETTPIVSTPLPTPTPTPSTPGFELGIFTAGLLACYFLLKRR